MKTVVCSLKPQIPRILYSSAIYRINCPGWMSSYVGQKQDICLSSQNVMETDPI